MKKWWKLHVLRLRTWIYRRWFYDLGNPRAYEVAHLIEHRFDSPAARRTVERDLAFIMAKSLIDNRAIKMVTTRRWDIEGAPVHVYASLRVVR